MDTEMQTPKVENGGQDRAEEPVPMEKLVEGTGAKESELQASGSEELGAKDPGTRAKEEISEEHESEAKEHELVISEEEEASPGLLISEIEERGPQGSGEGGADSKGPGRPDSCEIELDIEGHGTQASGEGGADYKGPGLQVIGDKDPEAKEPVNAEEEPGTAEPGARYSGEEEVVAMQETPGPSPSREERQAARVPMGRGASRGVLRGGRRGIRCSRCGARGSLSRSTRGLPPSYVRPHMRNHMDRNHHM